MKIGKNLQTAKYILSVTADLSIQKNDKLALLEDYTQPLNLGVHHFIYSEKDTEAAHLLKQMPDWNKHKYNIHHLNHYSSKLPDLLNDIANKVIEPKLYGGNQQAQHDDGKL